MFGRIQFWPTWFGQSISGQSSGHCGVCVCVCACFVGLVCCVSVCGQPPLHQTPLRRTIQHFAFFSLSRPYFFLSLGGLFVEFWWCFWRPGPVVWNDSPRKIPREDKTRETKRTNMGAGEGKKARNFGPPPPFAPFPRSKPAPLGPSPEGASPRCQPRPFRPPTRTAPNPNRPQPDLENKKHGVGQSWYCVGHRRFGQTWRNSLANFVWPKLATPFDRPQLAQNNWCKRTPPKRGAASLLRNVLEDVPPVPFPSHLQSDNVGNTFPPRCVLSSFFFSLDIGILVPVVFASCSNVVFWFAGASIVFVLILILWLSRTWFCVVVCFVFLRCGGASVIRVVIVIRLVALVFAAAFAVRARVLALVSRRKRVVSSFEARAAGLGHEHGIDCPPHARVSVAWIRQEAIVEPQTPLVEGRPLGSTHRGRIAVSERHEGDLRPWRGAALPIWSWQRKCRLPGCAGPLPTCWQIRAAFQHCASVGRACREWQPHFLPALDLQQQRGGTQPETSQRQKKRGKKENEMKREKEKKEKQKKEKMKNMKKWKNIFWRLNQVWTKA